MVFGCSNSLADELAAEVRERYIDPAGYVVYDDSVPTLRELTRRGWRHFILSNHVPELPEIVTALGLCPLVEEVITSATVDYEKPTPRYSGSRSTWQAIRRRLGWSATTWSRT